MACTDRPTDGQQEDCASDPRLTTAIRRPAGPTLDDRATKKPDQGGRALAHAAIA